MPPRKPLKPEPRVLTPEEQRSAIARLEARIGELQSLDATTINAGDDPPIHTLARRIQATLASIYGEATAEYSRLIDASDLDATVYVMNLYGDGGTSTADIRQGVDKGRHRAIAILQGEVDSLKEHLHFSSPQPAQTPKSVPELSNEIFVIHGHDDEFKNRVCDVIRRAGLTPVVLHEHANGGATIIEKFEKHAGAAGFAVALLTPDDVGGPSPDRLQSRARQNVIGEMFWFAGRLGRSRVCALRKGDVEVPSDLAGVVYTTVDDRGAWKADLLKESQAAGYTNLNWASVMSG